MPLFQSRGRILVVAMLAAGLAIAVGGWWFCERSPVTAFLPASSGAEWIIDPTPPENIARQAFPRRAVFEKSFTLGTRPASATLSIRAFKNATVTINGQDTGGIEPAGNNWKNPTTIAVAELLRPGTNTVSISVTNNLGPPALWLRLESDTASLRSDASWRVSLAGADWQNAHLASEPVALPAWSPLYDHIHTFDSLQCAWRELAFFVALALVFILAFSRWRSSSWMQTSGPLYALLGVIVIARTALFMHDMPDLHRRLGFDAMDHIEYVKFIQQKGKLPSPKDGWEMHQPPLYYLASALALHFCGVEADKPAAVVPLRALNCVIGLVHCWLALLCLRRLFPGRPAAQVVGLLVAACLPAHMYLSLFVTNDPLTGLLVTTAFYFLLRVSKSETENAWFYAGVGLALGAAMLTKLSALPAVPVFFLALVLRLVLRRNFVWRDWLRGVVMPAFLCFAVCGWHYGRSWHYIGAFAVPSSQTSNWWQDPGFRTWAYYLKFGTAWISPLLSGLNSFADGIYSTLWGDGLISGSSQLLYRPPWNYDLMNACYLLSLPLSIIALGGTVICLRQFVQRLEVEWLVIPALLATFILALVYLTISGPWLAEVKAFYAFPVLVPFCAVIAVGWDWLARKSAGLKMFLGLFILLWAFTACMAFWIPGNSPETWRSRAISDVQSQNDSAAADHLKCALQLSPDDYESHFLLAEVLKHQGKTSEAISQYAAALMLRPDSPEVLNSLAQIFANGHGEDAEAAVKLASHACELTADRRADMLLTLALARANAGRVEAALVTAEKACEVAFQNGDTNQVRQVQGLIEQLNGKGKAAGKD